MPVMQEPHCHRYPAQADPDPVPAYFPLLQAPPAAALQLPEPEVHPEDFSRLHLYFLHFFRQTLSWLPSEKKLL